MNISSKVSGISKKEYGAKYNDHALAIYEMYVDMADKVSARREATNSFFLTVNTGVLGLLGFLAQAAALPPGRIALLPVAVAGFVLSLLWRRILCSYRDLNSAKYKVILQIESSLPLRPYDAEWEALGRGTDPSKYLPLTHVESWVPCIFAVLHGIIVIWAMPWCDLVSMIGVG
jgi:hypothetical protein